MSTRLAYLDSIRGIAASIVLLGHFAMFYVSVIILIPYAAMPVLQRIWLSPLAVVVDCDTSVCLFFVLSGFVLTKVFAAHIATPAATLAGRAVRLFVPGVCACVYGFLLFLATAHVIPNEVASDLLGHWSSFFKDAFVSMPFLGYQGQSVFDRVPFVSSFLAPQLAGANPPLWSLSVEWQGSLLIFALVALRQRHHRLWAATMLALSLLLLRDWFICFLFGHVMAAYSSTFQPVDRRPWARRIVAGASLAFGLFLCGLAAEAFAGPFDTLIAANLPLPSCNDPRDSDRLYAAMFIFAGIFGLTELHRGLEHPALRWLGRMSFPIYLTHYPIEVWVVPILFKELPFWFWAPSPTLLAISPQIEYPRAVIAAFVVVIVLTLTVATGFLAIDRFAISAGHKLRAYMARRGDVKTDLAATAPVQKAP